MKSCTLEGASLPGYVCNFCTPESLLIEIGTCFSNEMRSSTSTALETPCITMEHLEQPFYFLRVARVDEHATRGQRYPFTVLI